MKENHQDTKAPSGTITWIAIVLCFCAVVVALGWLDYKIWRLKHPAAPTWTFIIGLVPSPPLGG